MGVKVRQKAKGKGKPWWVFVTHNGQRTSKRIGGKDAAQEVARQIEAKLALGEYSFESEKPTATFKDYADMQICFGNLAPGGIVFKVSSMQEPRFQGTAVCFSAAKEVADAVEREQRAGVYGEIVEQHRAGAAGAAIAHLLGAGQRRVEVRAQHREQRHARLDLDGALLPVDA